MCYVLCMLCVVCVVRCVCCVWRVVCVVCVVCGVCCVLCVGYGVSRVLSDMDQQGTRGVGTEKHMAPEVHPSQEFNRSCDVSFRYIIEFLCRNCPQFALPVHVKI